MSAPAEQYVKVSSRKVSDGIYELTIEGFVDFSSSEQVAQAIEEIFAKDCYKLIINLSQTKYISSAGFGCFISSIDTAMKNNGDIIFTGTPPEIKEIFDILGLSKILRFTNESKEAVKLLSETAA
jgi:anti-sigma B factor antagonist